jgi:hypothetical protein
MYNAKEDGNYLKTIFRMFASDKNYFCPQNFPLHLRGRKTCRYNPFYSCRRINLHVK